MKEVLLGVPQDQYGFLVDLVVGTLKGYLLFALVSQKGGYSLISYLLYYFLVNQRWVLQLKVLVVGLYLQGS